MQLKKPFFNVDHFVRLSFYPFKNDIELECVIVGIGAPYSSGYKVPVHVQYGSSACHIPELKWAPSKQLFSSLFGKHLFMIWV